MIRRPLLGLVLALAVAVPAAAEVVLEGELAQGGLVMGRVAPGTGVALDGAPVRVAPDGRFVLGFGRDAKPDWTLTLGGAHDTETHRLTVRGRAFPVQRIDGLPERKVTPDPEALARIRADAAAIAAVRAHDRDEALFASGLVWPVTGPVSGVFGSQRILNGQPRSPHSGVDIAAPAGTPVVAAADGVVALVAPDMFFTGKTLMIDHGHGLATVYAHLDAILVESGRRVRQGETIGRVGATGRATGPHLHWGLSWFDTRLDPALAAGPMPDARSAK